MPHSNSAFNDDSINGQPATEPAYVAESRPKPLCVPSRQLGGDRKLVGSSDTYRVTRWMGDVRPGGRWRSEGVSADGTAFAVGGDILEVDPHSLLVQTWRCEEKPGDVTPVRYRIDAISGGSRLTSGTRGSRTALRATATPAAGSVCSVRSSLTLGASTASAVDVRFRRPDWWEGSPNKT